MKPTAPSRHDLIVFATTPAVAYLCLVRLLVCSSCVPARTPCELRRCARAWVVSRQRARYGGRTRRALPHSRRCSSIPRQHGRPRREGSSGYSQTVQWPSASGLQALAVGWRIVRQHRVALAVRHYGATAPLSGTYRLRVVPWKQHRGYAKSALRLILPEARAVGLSYVEITTDPDNIASQRVIEANGGIFVEHFIKPRQFGCKPGMRFRIMFT
jgi:hypothetical protein